MRLGYIIVILAIAVGVLFVTHEQGEVFGLSSNDFSRLVMFATFALVVGPMALARFNGRVGAGVISALVWLALGVLLVGGYGMREELQGFARTAWAALVPGSVVTGGGGEAIIHRSADGHFRVKAAINGKTINMIVDTGASTVTLTDRDARGLGMVPEKLIFDAQISTANGKTTAAPIRLTSLALGSVVVQDVAALVARPGQLDQSLLGNSFLSRLSSYGVEGQKMTFRQ